jgi:NAD+-dependent protein deacetylase sirtuin 4
VTIDPASAQASAEASAEASAAAFAPAELEALVALLRGRTIVALTGAGCSTESGIPDYRSPERPPRQRPPIQHREFMDDAQVRRRYWARSLLGWTQFSTAQPNAGHRALAELEDAGLLAGIITQNVDSLHHRAGSRAVVELHGALARVRCLGCGAMISRDALQQRLSDENPGFLKSAHGAIIAPDGDAELPEALVAELSPVACARCDGALMPDVVFFGGSVAKPTLDSAWATFDRAEVLLVIGSSLTVFSGYRFVYRAAERSIPVAILNRGPTRGDPHATLRLDARAGTVLPELLRALRAR